MIDLARPGFFWAGALLALGPLLLHLLRPVERTRKMLPTSRFLTPDPKRRVRMHRVPDERRLLLLRMLLCLALGAAFAGVGWVGAERGVGTLVVVDGSGAMRDHWVVSRERLIGRPDDGTVHVVIVRPTSDAVPQLERLEPGIPTEARWAELAPSSSDGDVRLAHLVRAVRTGAERTLGHDSIAALVVTDPSWRAWTAGATTLRERIWPGRISLVVPATPSGDATAAASSPPDASRPAVVDAAGDGPGEGAPLRVGLRAPPELLGRLTRALGLIGATVDTAASTATPSTATAGPAGEAGIILSVGPGPAGWDGLWLPDGRDDGPAVAGPTSDETSSSGEAPAPDGPDAFLLLDGRTFPGAGEAPGGTPAAGTTVSLLRVGGRPAAAAMRMDTGCRVVLPLDPNAPMMASADLPLVLEGALEAGCGVLPEPPGAEEAFRRLLEDGTDREMVATAEIRDAGAGRPLERWILAFALLVAVAETWTSRRIEAKRSGRD